MGGISEERLAMLEAVIFVVFPFCMVYAAVSDMLSMTIANRVSLIMIATFAVVAPLTGMDWGIYGMHFAAAAVTLAITFALFALGGMGGGDAKLMTATALWLGFDPLLVQYLLLAGVVGGVLTVAILKYRGSVLAAFTGSNPFLRHFADERQGVPYGIALGFAGLVTFPYSPLAVWALANLAVAS